MFPIINPINMSSLGVKVDKSVLGQLGVYCIRIHGELWDLTGSSALHDVPKFAPIYYDN